MPTLPRGDPNELLQRQRGLGIDAGTCMSGDGQPAELHDLVHALLAVSS